MLFVWIFMLDVCRSFTPFLVMELYMLHLLHACEALNHVLMSNFYKYMFYLTEKGAGYRAAFPDLVFKLLWMIQVQIY